MTGISYMLPIVVLGGLLMAVTKITGEFIDIEGAAFQRLDMPGFMTMKFMYPVFAAYLAYSIAGGDQVNSLKSKNSRLYR